MTDPSNRSSVEDEKGLISDWLIRYDEALRRGDSPPEPPSAPAGVEGGDLERFQSFLDLLGRTLRLREAPSTPNMSKTLQGPEAPVEAGGELAAGAGSRPESIGRFRIEDELGRGGFGIVFRAFDPDMGRWVALKVPRTDAFNTPDVRRRFLREAHAAAQLDHPNLVPVFEVGEAGPVCYIASAYCEGPTLKRWMEKEKVPTDPRRAARLALALARGVEHMHLRGILHCDLKPGNVLLDLPPAEDAAADPTPRITDFGLARLADSPIGESTAARPWGTPPYMAPEQIQQRRDEIGPATDVYALGGILYELLTSRQSHRAKTTWELMRAVVSQPPRPPRRVRRSIPRDLDAIAMNCLEKRPDRRYPDAAALADDLQCYLDRRPTRARPLGAARRLGRWSARNPAATALLVMGLATVLVSLVYSIALGRALTRERRLNYVATLALAEQELGRGRDAQAQRRLRELIPAGSSSKRDPRDFAWHYLWRHSRRDRTVLDDVYPGGAQIVSAGDGVISTASAGPRGGLWRIIPERRSELPGLAPARPSPRFESPSPPAFREGLRTATLSADGRLGAVVRREDGIDKVLLLGLDGDSAATVESPIHHRGTVAFSSDAALLAFSLAIQPGGPREIAREEPRVENRSVVAIGVPEARGLAFADGGRRIASLRAPQEEVFEYFLEIWDVESGLRVAAREDEILGQALAVSPERGGPIATGTLEGVVQLRDPIEGKVFAELPVTHRKRVNALCFSPDGRRLVIGYDRLAILWDLQTGIQLAELDGLVDWVRSAVFMPGSPRDVVLGMGDGEVIIWHTDPIEDAVVLEAHADEVWGVAYAPDGRTLATVGGDRLLRFWDARTGAERKALPGHAEWPSCLAYHPSGKLLASGDFGGKVLIWDADLGRLVRTLDAHASRVRSLAFSTDGRLFATVGRDQAVRLWDTDSWGLLATLSGHRREVRGVAFSPDGRSLATGGHDQRILIWDVATRRLCGEWETIGEITSLAFSPDGRTLAAGEFRGAVHLYDPTDGTIRAALPALHSEAVSGLAFSPDGRVLAVAGQDAVVSLVDVETGKGHLMLTGHELGVNAVAFSPDGRTLASVSHDRTLRLWWAGPATDE